MFHKDSSGEYLQETLKNGLTRRYRRRRVLGKGGFAKCYEVTDEESSVRYACKVIDKELLSHSQLKQKLQTEIEIHRKLSHKNVVKFQRVFEDNKFLYILLELCLNNTLNELLKRRKVLSEVEVRYYMQQLLEALMYLHRLKIVHRDLKLDNFFLGESLQVKVGDFGLAAYISNKQRKTICGTPNYIAPEILESKDGYSYEVDVWSLGIVGFLLLYGYYPFESNDSKSIVGKISSKTYLINPSVSDIAKSFISKMLQMKASDRSSVKELLKHQFLINFEIPKTLPRSSLACHLNSNFLDQFKNKKLPKLELNKQDEQFNFMLESRDSPSSPMVRQSSISKSMSASKIMQLKKKQTQPYLFSLKKASSYRYECNPGLMKGSFRLKQWMVQWWENPKYGLLYQTSDGTLGLRYNDGDNVKAHPFPYRFTYIPKTGKKCNVSAQQIKSGELSRQLSSKLRIFSQMMEKVGGKDEQWSEEGIYVRMYLNCWDMFVVWLSNGNLQCRFEDKSELVVGSQYCMYINAHKIKTIFQSKALEEQSEEIIQRQIKLSNAIHRIRVKAETNIVNNKENMGPINK